jgi:hypothetical protein
MLWKRFLLLLSTSTVEGGGWSTPRPSRCTGTHCTQAGWAPRPVWTAAENFVLTGIRLPDHPSYSELLFRLRQPRPPFSIPIYVQCFFSFYSLVYIQTFQLVFSFQDFLLLIATHIYVSSRLRALDVWPISPFTNQLNDVLQSTNYDVFVVCHVLTISFKYSPQSILRSACKIAEIDY